VLFNRRTEIPYIPITSTSSPEDRYRGALLDSVELEKNAHPDYIQLAALQLFLSQANNDENLPIELILGAPITSPRSNRAKATAIETYLRRVEQKIIDSHYKLSPEEALHETRRELGRQRRRRFLQTKAQEAFQGSAQWINQLKEFSSR
jgi:hypothetical protein